MPKQVRMILAHVNEDGRSTAEEIFVDQTRMYDDEGRPVFAAFLAWGSPDGVPRVGAKERHAPNTWVPFFGGPGAVRFCIFYHLPQAWSQGGPIPEDWKAEAWEIGADTMPGLMEKFDPDRPGMHTSETIDCVYIISGDIYYEVDEGEVHLETGDVLVGRGAWHGWHNRSDAPCVMVAVLVGAERTD